ncbi:hypothetical protein M8C21_019794 [Ambrosia artemisiifolia]|uniref:Glutathione S-transferase n=1 Tax=Ambrosia artemisiifolia TaxID=4212 RepID=A0AAD5D1F9_AMBAR|nr:hypothetical protein M8C21_019794 [Ambrosia artemisiifolia]
MAKKCEMKLLGSGGSPFVTRVKFVLKLKSIDYEYIKEDLANKSELLLTSNPGLQKVPVIFHENEQPISESLVIVEYLDEILPNVHPILPLNPLDRAHNRCLAYYIDTVYCPWLKKFMLTRDSEKKEDMKRLIIGGSAMLEEAFVKLSKGGTFFGGDEIGYLDVVLGCYLGWFKFYGIVFGFNVIDEARNPRLAQWGKSMWSHEVIMSVIPSDEIYMNFFKMLPGFLPPRHVHA